MPRGGEASGAPSQWGGCSGGISLDEWADAGRTQSLVQLDQGAGPLWDHSGRCGFQGGVGHSSRRLGGDDAARRCCFRGLIGALLASNAHLMVQEGIAALLDRSPSCSQSCFCCSDLGHPSLDRWRVTEGEGEGGKQEDQRPRPSAVRRANPLTVRHVFFRAGRSNLHHLIKVSVARLEGWPGHRDGLLGFGGQ